MHVIARLPQQLHSRLGAALRPDHTLESISDPSTLDHAVVDRGDVFVVDPEALLPERIGHLPWATDRRDKIVLYADETPGSMRASLAVMRHGFAHVVLAGFDDKKSALRQSAGRQAPLDVHVTGGFRKRDSTR